MAASQVRLEDCTLREGEQSPDVNLTIDEKVELGRQLCDAGVSELEYGSPGLSASDLELGRRLKAAGVTSKLDALVHVFVPSWKEQIDAAIEGAADTLSLAHPSSDIRLEKVLHVSRAEVLDRCRESVTYACARARESGASVGFSPTDTTRADADFLVELASTAVLAGAEGLAVLDTAGSARPDTVGGIVERFVSAFGADLPIRVHCHNDHGLALANTLAGFEAGASVLQCSINGIGERTGIAALAEVAGGLEVLYGVSSGIDLGRLQALSAILAEIARVPTPPDRPLVGEYAYTHKLDAHVRGVVVTPEVYEPLPAERVGAHRQFALGKYSGRHAIRHTAGRLGIEVPEPRVPEVAQAIERMAAEKKSRLSDAEFEAIVRRSTDGRR